MRTAKSADTALAKRLLAGTQKHFSTVSSLTFGNRTRTPAEVEAFLQALIDLRAAVNDAQTKTRAALAAEASQRPFLRRRMSVFVAFVKVTFGEAADTLADFGLKPAKTPTPLTIEARAAAAAKRAATRAARHTMGKRQRIRVNAPA